jgi:hypothetical protein
MSNDLFNRRQSSEPGRPHVGTTGRCGRRGEWGCAARLAGWANEWAGGTPVTVERDVRSALDRRPGQRGPWGQDGLQVLGDVAT